MERGTKKWFPAENEEAFQSDIDKHLNKQITPTAGEADIDVDRLNEEIANAVKQSEQTFCTKTRQKDEKLSKMTRVMMKEREELKNKYDVNYPTIKHLNKDITKVIRNDIRRSNTVMITKAIEENRSMKVLIRRISMEKKRFVK